METGTKTRPELLLVSADTKASSELYEIAAASGRFGRIQRMADGRFALERLTEYGGDERFSRPDVLVVDQRLPGLSGVQLTRELRRSHQPSDLFIAFLPATSSAREQDEAESAGCDFYLPRPSNPADIASALNMIANRCEETLERRAASARCYPVSVRTVAPDVLVGERNRNA